MLSAEFIRDNEMLVKANIYNRGDVGLLGWDAIDEIIELDRDRKRITTELEVGRARQKNLNRNDRDEATAIKAANRYLEIELGSIMPRLEYLLSTIPNITLPEVPGSCLSGEVLFCNPKTGYRHTAIHDIFGYTEYVLRSCRRACGKTEKLITQWGVLSQNIG